MFAAALGDPGPFGLLGELLAEVGEQGPEERQNPLLAEAPVVDGLAFKVVVLGRGEVAVDQDVQPLAPFVEALAAASSST